MKSTKLKGVLLVALMAALILPCSTGAGTKRNTGKKPLSIVASIAPVADFIRQVGGERVEITLLLPPGADPHTFEPTPKLQFALAKAGIFIKIGGGIELWADRIVAGAGKKSLKTVSLIEGLKLIPYNREKQRYKPYSGDNHITNLREGRGDPHVWLDPIIVVSMVKRIAEAMSDMDPAGAPQYFKRAKAYAEELWRLDEEIKARVSKFSTRDFITFHNSWNYFARRYGLHLAGVIEEAPGREPGPRKLAEIIRKIKDLKTKVLFAEPQLSQRIARAVAAESGARILILDPLGGLPGRGSYLEMMRYNISIMEKGMR